MRLKRSDVYSWYTAYFVTQEPGSKDPRIPT